MPTPIERYQSGEITFEEAADLLRAELGMVAEPSSIEMSPTPLPIVAQPLDYDEWRDVDDTKEKLFDAEYERQRRGELASASEAAEAAHALVAKEEASASLRSLVGEGPLTRAKEALLPRAVPIGEEPTIGGPLGVAYQMSPLSMAGTTFEKGGVLGEYVSPSLGLVVQGENQGEWLLRLLSAPGILLEEFGIEAMGLLPDEVRARLPSWLPDPDPVKRGYDVTDQANFAQKYLYTVLDKIRHGRAIEDDIWDASGELSLPKRRALYAGALVAGILTPWEAPFIKIGGKALDVTAAGRAYQALEPNPTVGTRLKNAVQAVVDNLPGREVNVPQRIVRKLAVAMQKGQHKFSDIPERLLPELDALSREVYGQNFFDVFSEANPKHAVNGASGPVKAPELEFVDANVGAKLRPPTKFDRAKVLAGGGRQEKVDRLMVQAPRPAPREPAKFDRAKLRSAEAFKSKVDRALGAGDEVAEGAEATAEVVEEVAEGAVDWRTGKGALSDRVMQFAEERRTKASAKDFGEDADKAKEFEELHFDEIIKATARLSRPKTGAAPLAIGGVRRTAPYADEVAEAAEETADLAAEATEPVPPPQTRLIKKPSDAGGKDTPTKDQKFKALLIREVKQKKGTRIEFYRVDTVSEGPSIRWGDSNSLPELRKLLANKIENPVIDPAKVDEIWEETGKTNKTASYNKFLDPEKNPKNGFEKLLNNKINADGYTSEATRSKKRMTLLRVAEEAAPEVAEAAPEVAEAAEEVAQAAAKPGKAAPRVKPTPAPAPVPTVTRFAGGKTARLTNRPAFDRFMEALERDPEQAAQQVADAAWDASVGAAVREPADLDAFMADPAVRKYTTVMEQGIRRELAKRGAGEKVVNIGAPNGDAFRSLWVPKSQATTINKTVLAFLNQHNFDKTFDRSTGLYSPEFSKAAYEWKTRTTGSMPELASGEAVELKRLDVEGMNQLLFEVKSYLAGQFAQVRYAVSATSAGHKLVLDGLASVPGGQAVRRFMNKAASYVQKNIDLGLEDFSEPVQQVLEQVTQRMRQNGENLLIRAKDVQKSKDFTPTESVLRVLDEEPGGAEKLAGRYSTADPELAANIMEAKNKGVLAKSIAAAFENNRIKLSPELHKEMEDLQKAGLLENVEDGKLLEGQKVFADVQSYVISDMRDAVLDLLQGAYPKVRRADLKKDLEVSSRGPAWIARAWREFFVDGRFGPAFDELAKSPRGKRDGDELAAAVQYAIKQRLNLIKSQAIEELREAGLAISEDVARAARRILNGETETLTAHGLLESTDEPEHFAAAYRWLDQTGLGILQDPIDFDTWQEMRVPNEFARLLNEAAAHGGRNPALIHKFLTDDKPIGRLGARLFSVYKRMQLGGLVVPNTVYHLTNILDAMFLVHRNLGARAAFGVLKHAAMNPKMVSKVTMSLSSWTDILGDGNGLFRLALFDRQRYPTMKGWGDQSDFIRAPDGTIYTWDQIARYAHDNGLEATRARTELARNLADDMRRRASGTYTSAARGKLVAYQRGIQEISHSVEIAARVGIMIESLKSGKALPEAVLDARAGLLDYGRMTELEQGFLRLVFPFYAFNKANAQSFLRAAIKSPTRIRQQLQGIQATWDAVGITADERRGWSEYETSRIALATLSEDGQVFRADGSLDSRHRALGLFGPGLSTPQARSLWYDLGNIFTAGVLSQVSKPGAESEDWQSSVEDVAAHLNPVLPLAANAYKYLTGGDVRTKRVDRKLAVSPALMSMPVFSEFIETHFPVRKVYWDEDNEKWYDPDEYVVTGNAKIKLPAVHVIEGPAAQAAYVAFIDIFGSELSRPADFAAMLGAWPEQMMYTRKHTMSRDSGLPGLTSMPGVQADKLKSAQRIQQEGQERRLADLESLATPLRQSTPP